MDFQVPKVTKFASWGPDDPNVERIWLFIKAVIKNAEIDDTDATDFAADRLYEALVKARNSYSRINAPDFAAKPTSEQDEEYEKLYSNLWGAYKDRFTKLMESFGYSRISFMFAGDDFEKKAAAFAKAHPRKAWLVDYSRTLRKSWQTDLAKNRNAYKHSGDQRSVVDLKDPKTARQIFEVVCYAIENIFAYVVEEKLKDRWKILDAEANKSIFGRDNRFTLRLDLSPPKPDKLSPD